LTLTMGLVSKMPKRFRKPIAKDGELLAKYGQEYGERDIYYCRPDNECGMRRDCRILARALEENEVHEGRSLRQELERRGYDITTLKFSIMKLKENQ